MQFGEEGVGEVHWDSNAVGEGEEPVGGVEQSRPFGFGRGPVQVLPPGFLDRLADLGLEGGQLFGSGGSAEGGRQGARPPEGGELGGGQLRFAGGPQFLDQFAGRGGRFLLHAHEVGQRQPFLMAGRSAPGFEVGLRDEGSGFPDFGQQRGREGGGGLRADGQQGGELAGVQPAAG